MDEDKESGCVDGQDADTTLLVEDVEDAAYPGGFAVLWPTDSLIKGHETCFFRGGSVQMLTLLSDGFLELFVSQLTLLVDPLE